MIEHPARWWHAEGSQVRCDLCPRACLLAEGQAGYCRVRVARGGELRTWLRCSLSCDFCQNWGLSASSPEDLGLRRTCADEIVAAALAAGCGSVAFTYNEPSIGAEWCIEVAEAARAAGLLSVAVSSAYVGEAAWSDFFGALDAVNLDLKSFSDAFYRRRCKGRLAPVLATLEAALKSPRCSSRARTTATTR